MHNLPSHPINAVADRPSINCLHLTAIVPDPDHFVATWQVLPQELPADNRYLLLSTAASESLHLAANNALPKDQLPLMLNIQVDYLHLDFPLSKMVVEVDVLHRQERILCLAAYLYIGEKLLAKASATFSV